MQNDSEYHKLTYAHLWRHTKEFSTQGLCLAEFVDNSIASYLKSKPNENEISNISGCVIKITIDEQDPRNIKINILDNAGGMDRDELNKAAHEYNNTFGKSNNQLNQYGIGMKFAIFWFGKNGKIWTKRRGQPEYFLDYEAVNHNPEDSVCTPIIISKDNKIEDTHGTLIQIEGVYEESQNNRRLLKDSGGAREKLNDVLDTLRYRFRDYINKGLIINFFKITKDNPVEELCESIAPENIEKTMIFETKSFNLERICGIENFDEMTEDENADLKMRKAYFEQLKEIPEILNNPFYKKLIEKIDNNKPLIIDEEIKLNGHKLPVKLCFLAEPSSKYFGVAIMHCRRFIYHLPNKRTGSGDKVGTMPFTDKERFKDQIFRWMYAEADLTDTSKYGISPDKNKARLIWNDDRLHEWNSEFEKIIVRYEDFIRHVLQKITNKSNKDEKERILKGHKNGEISANFTVNDNDDVAYKINIDEPLSNHYKIGEASIVFKKSENNSVPFMWREFEENKFELEYDENNDIFNSKSIDLNLLKLVSLLKLISSPKYKTDEDILEMINNITKDKNLD